MDVETLFENLVSAYAKKLEKEREKRKEELIKEKEKREKEKKEEKIKEVKPLLRTFPALPPKPIEIEKISAKELEVKPSGFRYSIIEKIPETEKIQIKKEVFDFGKLNPIIYNNIKVLEVIENEKVVVEYRDGRKEIKDVVLSREEIESLIKKISEKTRLPIYEIFEAYFENFFIHAELKEKFRFTLIKIL